MFEITAVLFIIATVVVSYKIVVKMKRKKDTFTVKCLDCGYEDNVLRTLYVSYSAVNEEIIFLREDSRYIEELQDFVDSTKSIKRWGTDEGFFCEACAHDMTDVVCSYPVVRDHVSETIQNIERAKKKEERTGKRVREKISFGPFVFVSSIKSDSDDRNNALFNDMSVSLTQVHSDLEKASEINKDFQKYLMRNQSHKQNKNSGAFDEHSPVLHEPRKVSR